MRQVHRSLCAIAAFMLVFGAFSYTTAQTPSATPDPFVAQITSSPGVTSLNQFISFASDTTANGRFVVFESNGDVATQNRNNADGNRELFLFDYAQRRIFQLTNTRNVIAFPASPTPTPTPAASPTPTPGPTPADFSQIKFEISSNKPMITYDPPLVGGPPGTRTYTIVFSSNSPTLPNFDGTEGTLATNGNQELWVYRFTVTEVSNLSTGDEVFQDLSTGTFDRLTDTAPSRPLRPSVIPVDMVDDNREAAISDDGSVIAFISTADLAATATVNNSDRNPELFFWRASGFTQATNTQNIPNPKGGTFSVFQQNPSLSSDGTVVAFASTADLVGTNADGGHGNAEIYWANSTGGTLTNVRQVTKTRDAPGVSINILSPGRRLSRNGGLIAFESRAEDPKADTTATNTTFLAVFVYTHSTDSFAQVGPRALATPGDVIHFPTFTDYNSSGSPSTLVFASALNFRPDGTFPPADQDTTSGLNPAPLNTARPPQIFSTQVPVTSSNTFRRLTRNPVGGFGGINPLTSNSIRRLAFSMGGQDPGTGNDDDSVEVFYLLTPDVTSEPSSTLSYFTFPSNFPVPAASPGASPAPSPTPGTAGAGFAPGEFSIIRSTVSLAPSSKTAVGGPELERRPIVPVELNGVSVSFNGAAAGLYFVSDSEIHLVVPPSLATGGIATVAINNNGALQRGFVQIVVSQPDIFAVPQGPGGRAVVCNVTTASSGCIMEPFRVTTDNGSGTQVPTVLEIHVSGLRLIVASETRVTIGTTEITPSSVRINPNMYGEDLITVTLPSSLAPAAPTDFPVIVTVTKGGGTFTSRAAATAPQIQLIP